MIRKARVYFMFGMSLWPSVSVGRIFVKKKKKKVSQIENIQFWLKHAHANFFFPPLDDGETALRADGTL